MPFRMPARTALVTFAQDSPYHGAEVRCRLKVSLDEALEMSRLTASADQTDVDRGLELFANRILLGWNLEDQQTDADGNALPGPDGEPLYAPVPLTLASLRAQPADFVMPLVQRWQEVVTGVPLPSAPPSTSGAPSAAS